MSRECQTHVICSRISNVVVLVVTSVTLRPLLPVVRLLFVHFSAGRSQRPLGVTVEDSPVPALLFSGGLHARVGRVRLGWPTLGRWILASLTATGCSGSKGRYGSYRLVYVYVTCMTSWLLVVMTLVEAYHYRSLSFPIVPVSLPPYVSDFLPSFCVCAARTSREEC